MDFLQRLLHRVRHFLQVNLAHNVKSVLWHMSIQLNRLARPGRRCTYQAKWSWPFREGKRIGKSFALSDGRCRLGSFLAIRLVGARFRPQTQAHCAFRDTEPEPGTANRSQSACGRAALLLQHLGFAVPWET